MTDESKQAQGLGYKTVPVEPTPEMIQAGADSGGMGLDFHEWMGRIVCAWPKMIDAAPAVAVNAEAVPRAAIKEGERNGAADAYFKARHEMLDTIHNRRIFEAGFDRGYEAAPPAESAQPAEDNAETKAILLWIMRQADAAKVQCGMDPETPAAIRNGKLASIANAAARALGLIGGPSYINALPAAQPAQQSDMSKPEIKRILLASGFKEKQQPDGSMDLNPYCYVGATALLAAAPQPAQAAPVDAVIIDAYALPTERPFSDIKIQRARQTIGPDLWKVARGGECLSRDGGWEYEPLPSNRDDDFLDRCRWGSAEAAITAALSASKQGGA